MSHFVHLTEHAQWQLGLIPRGPVEPQVYGLVPVKRSQYGWMFRVETPWRWAVVQECWKRWSNPTPSTRQV